MLPELWQHIASFLDVSTHCSLRSVTKSFHATLSARKGTAFLNYQCCVDGNEDLFFALAQPIPKAKADCLLIPYYEAAIESNSLRIIKFLLDKVGPTPDLSELLAVCVKCDREEAFVLFFKFAPTPLVPGRYERSYTGLLIYDREWLTKYIPGEMTVQDWRESFYLILEQDNVAKFEHYLQLGLTFRKRDVRCALQRKAFRILEWYSERDAYTKTLLAVVRDDLTAYQSCAQNKSLDSLIKYQAYNLLAWQTGLNLHGQSRAQIVSRLGVDSLSKPEKLIRLAIYSGDADLLRCFVGKKYKYLDINLEQLETLTIPFLEILEGILSEEDMLILIDQQSVYYPLVCYQWTQMRNLPPIINCMVSSLACVQYWEKEGKVFLEDDFWDAVLFENLDVIEFVYARMGNVRARIKINSVAKDKLWVLDHVHPRTLFWLYQKGIMNKAELSQRLSVCWELVSLEKYINLSLRSG